MVRGPFAFGKEKYSALRENQTQIKHQQAGREGMDTSWQVAIKISWFICIKLIPLVQYVKEGFMGLQFRAFFMFVQSNATFKMLRKKKKERIGKHNKSIQITHMISFRISKVYLWGLNSPPLSPPHTCEEKKWQCFIHRPSWIPLGDFTSSSVNSYSNLQPKWK